MFTAEAKTRRTFPRANESQAALLSNVDTSASIAFDKTQTEICDDENEDLNNGEKAQQNNLMMTTVQELGVQRSNGAVAPPPLALAAQAPATEDETRFSLPNGNGNEAQTAANEDRVETTVLNRNGIVFCFCFSLRFYT